MRKRTDLEELGNRAVWWLTGPVLIVAAVVIAHPAPIVVALLAFGRSIVDKPEWPL